MDVILYSAWQKSTPGQEDHLGGSFAQCTLLVSSSYLILNVPSLYPSRTLLVPSTYHPRILLVYSLYPPRILLVSSSYPSNKYQPLQICPTVWWASFVPCLCTDQVQIGKTWEQIWSSGQSCKEQPQANVVAQLASLLHIGIRVSIRQMSKSLQGRVEPDKNKKWKWKWNLLPGRFFKFFQRCFYALSKSLFTPFPSW